MTENEPSEEAQAGDRDAARVRVFQPGIPLAIILASIGLNHIWPLDLGVANLPWLRYGVGGGIVLLSVYFFGFRAVSTMRKTGQSENPYKTTTEIVESGPYAMTRNPMYLQMVLVCFGFSFLLSNGWTLILTPACAVLLYALVIKPEETYLERKFGEPYLEYKTRVRRWI
jgi:protein-S-isoprenylcysteine O-methyltransferase Ste14